MAAKKSKKEVKPAGTKKTKREGPKRPLSAYMYFAQERRKIISGQNPGLNLAEMSKTIGAEWQELNDDQKTKYKKMQEEDKARYEREKAKA